MAAKIQCNNQVLTLTNYTIDVLIFNADFVKRVIV